MKDKPRICETCDFWDIDSILIVRGDVTVTPAQCRRHPPQGESEWPTTFSEDWCGEWKPRRKDPGGDAD